MERIILTGNDLYQTLIAGAKRLIGERATLNAINVFPVPDGDTGTNLSHLMQTIVDEAVPGDTVGETMASIANAALSGSRGNSGIIFSEYLNGLYEHLKDKAVATLDDFAAAVGLGVRKAYQALAKPVEGTILTVLRKAFPAGVRHATIDEFVARSYQRAKDALVETTKELDVLARNGVVDAGAQGFTVFLEGMHRYLETGVVETTVAADPVAFVAATHAESVTERYCTEAVLLDATCEPSELRETLAVFGSSLIVSGRRDRMRLHIHTNRPDLVFLKLGERGRIGEQKVDDMVRQLDALAAAKPRVAVVTDSIADLPAAMMDELHIHLLPIPLFADGTNYLDKVTVSSATFYDIMAKARETSTSQPSAKQIGRLLDFLAEHYESVLVLTVSSAMSGTHQAVLRAAQAKDNVVVFDTLLNSGAEGLVVRKAAELAASGMSLEDILKVLPAFRDRTRIYVAVETLAYMVKQGRVPKATGLAAKVLNLKPVVSIDALGAGNILHKAFSRRASWNHILKLVSSRPVESYAVVHAGVADRAAEFARRIEAVVGKAPLYLEEISPVVAMNAGIGAIAVAVTFQEA